MVLSETYYQMYICSPFFQLATKSDTTPQYLKGKTKNQDCASYTGVYFKNGIESLYSGIRREAISMLSQKCWSWKLEKGSQPDDSVVLKVKKIRVAKKLRGRGRWCWEFFGVFVWGFLWDFYVWTFCCLFSFCCVFWEEDGLGFLNQTHQVKSSS